MSPLLEGVVVAVRHPIEKDCVAPDLFGDRLGLLEDMVEEDAADPCALGANIDRDPLACSQTPNNRPADQLDGQCAPVSTQA